MFNISQDKILEDLNKQYAIYSKNLEESKLDNKILFEFCLSIILYTRNTNFFLVNDDLIDAFKAIFDVYLYKMMNMKYIALIMKIKNKILMKNI